MLRMLICFELRSRALSEANSNSEIRFGAFEVLPDQGILCKHGLRIRLPDQSFTVLLVLAQNPGKVVSREDLRRRLWADDTFTDFDHGLNAAVNRLREALGDSASDPKFIETLPRRGYRFIAAIENQQRDAEETSSQASPSPPADLLSSPKAGPRLRVWPAALAVLPLAAIGGWLLWQRFQVPAPTPTLHVLTTYPHLESQPCFSPDGKQVAFTWGGPSKDNTDIYVKFVGAENALRLTVSPALDLAPAWSPDGKQIAFLRAAPHSVDPVTGRGNYAVHVISPLGGDERRLADVPGAIGNSLSWSPDGKWLALARPPGEAAGVFLLPAAGGEPRQITSPRAPVSDRLPVFSPDGTHLAYVRCTSTWACDLYLQETDSANAPQGDSRRITQQHSYIMGVTWVGDSLVYSGSLSMANLPYLWRAGADGIGDPQRLEIAGVGALFPVFSPAAGRLAFVRMHRNRDIWQYGSDGSHNILVTSSLDEVTPQFSPNGEKIAFSSSRSGDAFEIWVMNADGSNPVQLTNKVGRFHGSPRWSPDGRWIAFDSQPPDGKQDIYVIDATGGRPRKLDLGPYQNALPSWSRDGMWIYYVSNRTGSHEIWRVRASGGQPVQITDNGGHNAMESVDGKTLYYAKENSGTPIFARSLAGGPERKIIDYHGLTRDFPVFEDGIYYGGRADLKGKVPLLFYQFSTGASRPVASLDPHVHFGLTVSPDRKTILYTRSLSSGGDLMLIENFR